MSWGVYRQAHSRVGRKAGEHVRSKQGRDWGVPDIQGAGRTLDSHLHFPDKDTEMQQDEGAGFAL